MIKIILNCIDLKINTGGIARLNILLENFLQKKKYNFIVSTLSGYHKKFLLSPKIYNSYNSKIIFFLKNFIFQFLSNFAIYSHVALAKAHILNKNSYLIFIYGRDIWNIKSKRQIDLLKKAKYLISCSKFTINKSEKIHNVKFNNAISIWPGLGKKFFRFKNKKKHKNVNLLIVGRIVDEQKGHFKILESIMILKDKFHNVRLTIIGDGPFRKNLEDYVRINNLQNYVTFKGFVSQKNIQYYWNKTDIYVMPSVTEGFGFVYIEAMRNALPIIASVHDSGKEINVNNFTGFNVNLNKKHELTEKLAILIKNKKLRIKMGKNSLSRWKNNFTKRHYENRLDFFFKTIVNKHVQE